MDIEAILTKAVQDMLRGNRTDAEPRSCVDDLVDRYVVVRCRDAGVHAGFLRWRKGRECYLEKSRRLWRWVPKQGKWLSAVARNGLDDQSKLGAEVDILLTENCEILLCSTQAKASIQGITSDGGD